LSKCFTTKYITFIIELSPRTEQINKLNRMPQLIPFYFLNQLSFSFLTLLVLIYVFSKYILPLFTFQQVIRMYITKLSKKA